MFRLALLVIALAFAASGPASARLAANRLAANGVKFNGTDAALVAPAPQGVTLPDGTAIRAE